MHTRAQTCVYSLLSTFSAVHVYMCSWFIIRDWTIYAGVHPWKKLILPPPGSHWPPAALCPGVAPCGSPLSTLASQLMSSSCQSSSGNFQKCVCHHFTLSKLPSLKYSKDFLHDLNADWWLLCSHAFVGCWLAGLLTSPWLPHANVSKAASFSPMLFLPWPAHSHQKFPADLCRSHRTPEYLGLAG